MLSEFPPYNGMRNRNIHREARVHRLRILVLMCAGAATAAAQTAGGLTLAKAIDSTLSLHPLLGVSRQQVALRQGIRREVSGAFDRLYQSGGRQSYSHAPALDSSLRFRNDGVNSTSVDGAAMKLYRNGVTAGPTAVVSRTRSPLLTPDGLNLSRMAFEVSVPLRRNAATQVIARENSATQEVDAARFDLNQTAANLLAETAVRYWELRGALLLLDVFLGSERRGETFLEMTQTLIQAERIPRNDINLVRANLAGRTATRIESEQAVIAARQALAYAMGLVPEEMQRLADPAADLPESASIPGEDAIRAYVSRALARRTDYQAAQRRVAAARALVPGAENQTRPSIDVVLSSGYSGLRAGAAPTSTLASLFRGVGGADAIASLRYEFAPANNTALGRLAQVTATVRQAELQASDLARSITADVNVAGQAVRNAALRTERARESVAAFQDALAAERDKYTLGFGSLVDILTTEDRLTQALVLQVRAQIDYAQALADLRQATGTILEPDADLTTLVGANLERDFRSAPKP